MVPLVSVTETENAEQRHFNSCSKLLSKPLVLTMSSWVSLNVEMDLYDAGKEIDFQKARARLEELAKPPETEKEAKV
jgi:hypothetical protein